MADIFGALTSRRPYKQAWRNNGALTMLEQLSGDKLGPDCVRELIERREEMAAFQRQFSEGIVV